jgi:AmmeMemoRadiSam system protein A
MITLPTSAPDSFRTMIAECPLTSLPLLTAAERRELLWLARESIRTVLRDEDAPTVPTLTLALCEPTAVFVSLHHEGHLRGCIGTLTAERPLHEAVVRTARSAALADPRFPPLREAELPAVHIEISRLSALVPARPEQVRPGSHGVCVRCGERRAVFLPQVATLYNWDRERLLRELCRKAMLPPDAWQRPEISLSVFSAEVFGDEGENL